MLKPKSRTIKEKEAFSTKPVTFLASAYTTKEELVKKVSGELFDETENDD